MFGQIIIWGIVLLLIFILLYNIFYILSILFNKEEDIEDRHYKVKKNFYDLFLALLQNFRRFLDVGQYRRQHIDPNRVVASTFLGHTIDNIKKADPALKVKREIENKISEAIEELENALENAQKHKSLEAESYIIECYEELKMIRQGFSQQDSFSQIKERIGMIIEQARIIAEANTFDDAGSETSQENIPPQSRNYYEILGLDKDASQEQIKKAYRDLAKKYHPDRYADLADDLRDQAEQRFKEINEAFSVLSDTQKRAEYDSRLS